MGSSANREMLISVSSQSAGALLTDEADVDLEDDEELLEMEEASEVLAEAESAACSLIFCRVVVSAESFEGRVARARLVEIVA